MKMRTRNSNHDQRTVTVGSGSAGASGTSVTGWSGGKAGPAVISAALMVPVTICPAWSGPILGAVGRPSAGTGFGLGFGFGR